MTKKFRVFLSSVGNPDHWQNPDVPVWGVPNKVAQVDTLEEASQKCLDYIEEYDLGGGNWIGGYVQDGEKHIASISYNGRIWDKGTDYFNEEAKLQVEQFAIETERNEVIKRLEVVLSDLTIKSKVNGKSRNEEVKNAECVEIAINTIKNLWGYEI